MANIYFVGLASQTAAQLERAMANKSHKIVKFGTDTGAEKLGNADVIFAAGDDFQYRGLLADVRARKPHQPFVVVTRLPDTRAWLDALEAGATDFCAEPIESKQLGWVLDSALGKRSAKAAA